MNPELEAAAIAKAKAAARSEKQRRNVSEAVRVTVQNNQFLQSIEDPDESMSGEGGGSAEIWKLLPHLSGVAESTLRSLPLSAIFQLNLALQRESKCTAKQSVNARLAHNAQQLLTCPTRVPEGLDNRKTILHSSRFLGGPSCSNVELWLQSKRALAERPALPLGNYDLDSVGCGGCVTPKGWMELQNPASQELRLKQFYLPNVGGAGLAARKVSLTDGEEALSIGDNLKDIADMEGVRAALNTAREAMHSAQPWNRSISAIIGFMTNNNYLQEDLLNNPKKAQVVVEFVDYVFGRNALNYENDQGFLTSDDLTQVWANWKGKRSVLFAKPDRPGPKKDPKQERKNNICRRWNYGDCKEQAKSECKSFYGTTLRHVCNFPLRGGKFCEKNHTKKDHK
jgi:hypothetical protein